MAGIKTPRPGGMAPPRNGTGTTQAPGGIVPPRTGGGIAPRIGGRQVPGGLGGARPFPRNPGGMTAQRLSEGGKACPTPMMRKRTPAGKKK